MTHTGNHYNSRRQPSRAGTKDSWITIDWGDRAPPSHLHGVLDQIAGTILRDPKLVQQGKTEWRKASILAKERKRRAARRKNSGSKTPHKSGSTSRSGSGRSSPKSKPGFLSSLFGAASSKKKPTPHRPSRSGTLRRAMTTPGKQHSSSTAQVRRRATDGGRRR